MRRLPYIHVTNRGLRHKYIKVNRVNINSLTFLGNLAFYCTIFLQSKAELSWSLLETPSILHFISTSQTEGLR